MTDQEPTLTLDGKDYKISDLSEEAKNQLQSLQLAETEIKRLQMQLAMVQTARNAYQQALIYAQRVSMIGSVEKQILLLNEKEIADG